MQVHLSDLLLRKNLLFPKPRLTESLQASEHACFLVCFPHPERPSPVTRCGTRSWPPRPSRRDPAHRQPWPPALPGQLGASAEAPRPAVLPALFIRLGAGRLSLSVPAPPSLPQQDRPRKSMTPRAPAAISWVPRPTHPSPGGPVRPWHPFPTGPPTETAGRIGWISTGFPHTLGRSSPRALQGCPAVTTDNDK